MRSRRDELDPLPYDAEWPSLRAATGRIDIHSLAAFWVRESRLKGDYFEFGVASGRSAVAARRAQRLYGWEAPHSFHLFDSFRGLPELAGPDAGSAQFAAGAYAYGQGAVVEELMRREVWDEERVFLYPGWYEQSLTAELAHALRSAGSQVAIAHIDCDLYESTRHVLRFVTPLLQPGALLLFDDWFCFGASASRGERRAATEWLGSEGSAWSLERYAEYGWHGAAFVCIERA